MPAQLRIDQAGLPAGTPGKSRTDGLDTGAVVTLTNTGLGTTTTFRLLWVPPGDTTAATSLAATGDPKVWTFTPTEEVYGSYRVELVENEGLVTEKRERRVLDLVAASLGRDEPDLETIVIVMATLSGEVENERVISTLDSIREGWRLPICRGLSTATQACIEEVARRLKTDVTSAECALRDYCDELDDDETVPSTGFGAWVQNCMLEIQGAAE